jgi:hypothetical protein
MERVAKSDQGAVGERSSERRGSVPG